MDKHFWLKATVTAAAATAIIPIIITTGSIIMIIAGTVIIINTYCYTDWQCRSQYTDNVGFKPQEQVLQRNRRVNNNNKK